METLFHSSYQETYMKYIAEENLEEGIKEIITTHPLIPHQGPILYFKVKMPHEPKEFDLSYEEDTALFKCY